MCSSYVALSSISQSLVFALIILVVSYVVVNLTYDTNLIVRFVVIPFCNVQNVCITVFLFTALHMGPWP